MPTPPPGPTPAEQESRWLAPLPSATRPLVATFTSPILPEPASPYKENNKNNNNRSPNHSPHRAASTHFRKHSSAALGPSAPGDLLLLIRRNRDDAVHDIVSRLQACGLSVNVHPLDKYEATALAASQELTCKGCCPTGRFCFCCCRCTRQCCESCGTAGTPLESLLRGSCLTQHGLATSDIGTAIFVSATLGRLNELQQQLHDERLREQTSVVDHVYVYHTFFSAAERSQLLDRVVQRPIVEGGAGLRASPPNEPLSLNEERAYPTHPAIEVVTTLHDPHFVHELFQPRPTTSWYIWFQHFFHGGIVIEELRPETRAKLTCPNHIHPNQYFIHELRANYGEETAYFFAFNYHMVRMLYLPAVAGLFLSIVAPMIHSSPTTWGRGFSAFLTLGFGVLVSIVWGSVFMIMWARRTAEYNFQWHGHVDGFVEASYPNPDYRITGKCQIKDDDDDDGDEDDDNMLDDDLTQATTKTCAFMWRYLVVGAFGFIWVLLFSHAVAWYVVLRARHTFLAWIGLLITKDALHGILMAGLGAAIFKGVIGGLMSLENYRTEKERRREETCTMCSIEWWNFFVGLLILSFVFIPLVDSGLFADSLVRDNSVLNIFFKSVMNGQDPTDSNLWPKQFIDQEPIGVYANTTGTVAYHPHADARNHIQRSLLKENIRLILIGPVIVARILITVVGTIVPFCLQSRRREELQASLTSRRAKMGGGLKRIMFERTSTIRNFGRKKQRKRTSIVPSSFGGGGSGSKFDNHSTPSVHLEEEMKHDAEFLLSLSKACRLVQAHFRGMSARNKVAEMKMALKGADSLVEEAGLVPWDSFVLFNDLNLQLTLVLFFSSVATWIPFVVLLANCVEVRARCATLAYSSRPPPSRSTSGIGTWSKLMLMGTWIAVAVNCAMLIIPTETLEAVSGCSRSDMNWRLDTDQFSLLMRYVNLGASGNVVGFFASSGGLPSENADNTTLFEMDAYLSEARRLQEGRLTPCVSNSVRFSFYAGSVGFCAAVKGLLHFSLPTVPDWIHVEAKRIREEGRRRF